MRDPNLSRFPSSRTGVDMDMLLETGDVRRLVDCIIISAGKRTNASTCTLPHITTKRKAANASTIVFMILKRMDGNRL